MLTPDNDELVDITLIYYTFRNILVHMTSRISFFFSNNSAAIASFLVATIGGLMPLWLTACLLWFFGIWQGFIFFWLDGEFYLYSAAFSTQAIYLLLNYIIKYNDKKNVTVIIMLAVSSLILIFSTFFYAAAITSSLTEDLLKPNDLALAVTSLILLLASLLLVFGGEFYHGRVIDVQKISNDKADELEKEI